jgi:hypothetical protein
MCKRPGQGKGGGGKTLMNRRTLAIDNPFEFRKTQPYDNLSALRVFCVGPTATLCVHFQSLPENEAKDACIGKITYPR